MLCAFTAELVIGREIVSKSCDMMLAKDTLDCHFFGQFFLLNFLMRKADWIFSQFYLYQKIRVSMVSISNSSWYVNYKTGNSFDDPSLISAAVAAILQVVELNTNHYDIMKRDFNALHDKCRPISILLVMLLGDSEKYGAPWYPLLLPQDPPTPLLIIPILFVMVRGKKKIIV